MPARVRIADLVPVSPSKRISDPDWATCEMRRVLRRERWRETRDVGEKEVEEERRATSRSRGVNVSSSSANEDTEEHGNSATEVETPQTESEFE